MSRLQTEAKALKAAPTLSTNAARSAFETATKERLGSDTQIQWLADRASINLKNVRADALAAWLTQVRENAHMVPARANLTRHPGSNAAWDGTIGFGLPSP